MGVSGVFAPVVQGDLVTIASNENGVLWVTKQNS